MMSVLKLALPLALVFVLSSCEEKKNTTEENKKPHTTEVLPGLPPELPVNSYSTIDVSPMDMSYFPVDYPKLKIANEATAGPVARVIYSRPHLGKRKFREIVKMNEPWRMGANESTEIDFYKPVTIMGKKVNNGRYILYCIPHDSTWTIALNTSIDTWGLKQDSTRDVHRFEVPVTISYPSMEYLTMLFEKSATGADLIIGWDEVRARLPISF